MQLPLEITFRNMDPSEAVAGKVRERADKLDRFSDQLIGCRVIIEAPHRHQHKGGLYHVRIDMTVPGRELVVSRAPGDNQAHQDVYVAVRDAFGAARRQLEEHTRSVRGRVKSHEVPPHGRVRQLASREGYGIIETPDGRDVYFHRNSVVNGDFARMEVGNEVRFAEEMGDEGPQASSVHLIGKHHLTG